ncbi:MAG: serine/threonine protein kinase [Myxococcales bacterium]|nr:serine/threonine protein kinase [Myxococcales bacterium]
MSLAKALPRPCPTCGEISGGVFCPADGAPLAGSFSIGGDRYLVDELIGSGAMAIVFGGHHRTLSRPVAVKVLRPEVARNDEQQQRFLREARSASRLNHENIVGVLDFGWDDDLGVTYMVMERVLGETLAAELSSSGRMAWRDAVSLLVQICRAVATAHAAGIVHRDLSPRNVILVNSSGRRVAKLCDFGLSRHTEGGDRVTQNGAWVGTPSYMAPEQVDHEVVVEPSADIYAIGVIAYELLTGHLPVVGDTSAEVLAAKLTDEVVPLTLKFPELGVPEELDTWVLRCLQRDPASRPSASELERGLTRLSARATALGEPGSLSAPAIAIPRTLTPAFPPLDDGSPSLIGSYRVVRSLGTGGTGRVYLGEHPVIGTKVAIKVLLPEIAGSQETVERFIQEARSSSQIDSPHIPRYYDFGRTAGGLPYAVMEYFEGETLAERIEKVGALSVEETAGILVQVAGALMLAHKAGLIHRDLKPENLFLVAAEPRAVSGGGVEAALPRAVTASGSSPALLDCAYSVKVLDFGIAKSFGKDAGTRTQQGFFLGTPFYCAPEQVFGAEVDPRADVYALGVTAFEMLTGMPPFVGEISEVLEAKTSQDAPLLRSERPELPERVERTVARMLARDLKERADSMAWVKEQLELWLRPELDLAAASGRFLRAASVVTLRATTATPAPRHDQASAAELDGARARAASAPALGAPGVIGDDAGDGGEPELAGITGELPVRRSRARSSAPRPSSPALAVPASLTAPLVIESARPHRAHHADGDFDALETISLSPGARPTIPVSTKAAPPAWKRPLPILLAVSALLGVAAVGLVVGGGEGGGGRGPVVTPIQRSPQVSPLQARTAGDPEPAVPPAASLAPAVDPAGEPPREPAEEPSVEVKSDDGEEPRSADGSGQASTRKAKSRKTKRRGDSAADDKGKPSTPTEPEPPRDVKLVDPFAN